MDYRASQIMIGSSSGGILITGTTAVTGNFNGIVVNEDAVFDELDVAGEDVMTTRGLTGNTVTAGMFIGPGLHQSTAGFSMFTNIKLVSGSVIAY